MKNSLSWKGSAEPNASNQRCKDSRAYRTSWASLQVLTVILMLVCPSINSLAETKQQPSINATVRLGADRKLNYVADELGNQIPDFSHCGYAANEKSVPQVAAVVLVEASDSLAVGSDDIDDTVRIQRAIDYVANRSPNSLGFRGAVLLGRGVFSVSSQLLIQKTGVVLRGMGAGENGTTIRATGKGRRALIRVVPPTVDRFPEKQEPQPTRCLVADAYVPVGAKLLRLESTDGLRVGRRVRVKHASTKRWISELDIDNLGWREGTRDIHWDRTITRIEGQQIELDAPITIALSRELSQGYVEPVDENDLLQNVGIENLSLRAEFEDSNPLDEEHAWYGIHMQGVRDAWVTNMEFRHFAGGAVMLEDTSSRVTVRDCVSLAPVSEIGGYRRHTYFTRGQQCLFLRCWSEAGRHDFSVGHCAAGPNAFVNCYAKSALKDSGPIESMATGVLFDNVRIDGHDLSLINRWNDPSKTGWSAVNCVLWQCQAANIRCDRTPVGQNWVIGFWSNPMGNGHFEGSSDFVKPLSLFRQQLKERLGDEAANRVGRFLLKPTGATNPSVERAKQFAAQSKQSSPTLQDLIRSNWQIERLSHGNVPKLEELESQSQVESEHHPNAVAGQRISIKNGWLTSDRGIVTGDHYTPLWWRGDMQRQRAAPMGPAITRFAPGRYGTGLTDDLKNVAKHFQSLGVVGYDHHYGLWYERRRDDHLMVKRADGNVAPPFYEQPFARSGRGKAWDGLSLYDLTKFNHWYWNRLQKFASLAEQNGFVLFHHNYFQHNILEAGAHWADSPWRPANNVNNPELPEPPPYVGDKRIFIAESFYDISKPKLRSLHRNYIRQCLNNFAKQSNVIQLVSAEYSGPLHFVEFWLDTISEWERETARDAVVALSCPRDVQEAILQDPKRREVVDVIDIRYWTYTSDDQLYGPDGGQHLSPRQHLRRIKPKSTSFDSIARSVRECRASYPDKAVTYYADIYCRAKRDGWAILIGGGSLANVPALPQPLCKSIAQMSPSNVLSLPERCWCLGNEDREFLICSSPAVPAKKLKVDLPSQGFEWIQVDTKSGELMGSFTPVNDKRLELSAKGQAAFWLRLRDK